MTEKKKLQKIIQSLLEEDAKAFRKLQRGLVIAYTPEPYEDRPGAGARIVWSRIDVHPSELEDTIMKTAVLLALRSCNNRAVVAGPMFRTGLVLKQGWGSSMMTWRWVATAELNMLSGLDRDRAIEWVNGR